MHGHQSSLYWTQRHVKGAQRLSPTYQEHGQQVYRPSHTSDHQQHWSQQPPAEQDWNYEECREFQPPPCQHKYTQPRSKPTEGMWRQQEQVQEQQRTQLQREQHQEQPESLQTPDDIEQMHTMLEELSRRDPGPVTIILRNIACKYNQEEVKQHLDDYGLQGTFSLIYMPRSGLRNSNFGYAFVRFKSRAFAEQCARRVSGKMFGDTWTRKLCHVELANVQETIEATMIRRRRKQNGVAPALLLCDDPLPGQNAGASAASGCSSVWGWAGTAESVNDDAVGERMAWHAKANDFANGPELDRVDKPLEVSMPGSSGVAMASSLAAALAAYGPPTAPI